MKLIATLLIMGSLAACATTSIDAGKSLAIAWQSLDAAAITADAAVHSGKLKGAQAGTVAADLRKASAALTTATQAYGVANGADPSVQIAIALAATAEITTILNGVK